jgi:glycosyltransferase involved in cell wall biosynthesis
MKDLINIIIFVYNNEDKIEEIIDNAKILTDKIIVIDLESEDQTAQIAKKNGAVVFTFPHPIYVEPARDFGIKKANSQWVLILDADERITKDLAAEIIKNIQEAKNQDVGYFKIPRKNIFIDRWLKHGGWWPDYQIRLINKKYYKNWPKEIHSSPQIEGKAMTLNNPLPHYFHGNLSKMVEKTIIFENIESDLLFRAGRTASTVTFFRKFFGELFRRMFKNLGFVDGAYGIIESIYQAFSKTITYLYLYEKRNTKKSSAL